MIDKFDVSKWKKDILLKEIENTELDPKLIFAIHKYLTKKLDNKAIESGDRMSYFSAEYPLATSFYNDLVKNLDISINEATESITPYKVDILYTEGGMFYGLYMYEQGKKNWSQKIPFTSQANNWLKSEGVDIELPRRYDDDILKEIASELEKKGIKASYDDIIDIS